MKNCRDAKVGWGDGLLFSDRICFCPILFLVFSSRTFPSIVFSSLLFSSPSMLFSPLFCYIILFLSSPNYLRLVLLLVSFFLLSSHISSSFLLSDLRSFSLL